MKTRRETRLVLGPVVACLLTLGHGAAAADAPTKAPTKAECVAANESAQTLRREGKLLRARAELAKCMASSCPGAVREDCAERLADVDRAIPTVVFAAHGPDGSDLSAVRVTMDGAPFLESLNGAAISVEPGDHVFVFTAKGFPTVTRTLTIREGAKAREEMVQLGTVEGRGERGERDKAASADRAAAEGAGKRQRTLALILGGVGVVGVGLGTYFGLAAKSTYDDARLHCPSGPNSCDADGVKNGSVAHDQALASTIAFAAGGALLGGAALLFFTAPRGAVTVNAAMDGRTAGLRVGGAF